jgi:hypothetical protein
MCGAGLGLGLQLLGLGTSGMAAKNNAASQQVTMNGQADVADINARLAETAAESVILSGQREEQKSRLSTAQLKGTQRAALAANGVDLGVGSAENILTTTDVMGEIDANTIQRNAISQAWGYKVQAVNEQSKARSLRAGSSAINPDSAMASTLIGGAGSVASSWYQMGKPNPFADSSPKLVYPNGGR